jgi:hypothetical protein
MGSTEINVLSPIKDVTYLQKLLEYGYTIEGPRKKNQKNLVIFKRFLEKGYDFIPEGYLENNGYEFVENSTLTKGFKLAYKINTNGFIQYFRSNYSLRKNDEKIYLYTRKREKDGNSDIS